MPIERGDGADSHILRLFDPGLGGGVDMLVGLEAVQNFGCKNGSENIWWRPHICGIWAGAFRDFRDVLV